MNPSTALATVLVDELIRSGVREAVLCPGSRTAPLAFALHEADAEGRLRLHVRIDERTAGFLALGLAKASGRPVPVVTTSGTAAVNLHPAVVEADYSGVPLVVLTADRPAELRGTGANQTIDQVDLYGRSVRFFADVSVDEEMTVTGWRELVDRALSAGIERSGAPQRGDAGAARPGVGPDLVRAAGRGDRTVTAASRRPAVHPAVARPAPAPWWWRATGPVRSRGRSPRRAGWPLLAEPSSGSRAGSHALATYRLLLSPPRRRHPSGWSSRGRPTLSRAVTALLGREDVEVVRVPRDAPTPRGDRRARRSLAVPRGARPTSAPGQRSATVLDGGAAHRSGDRRSCWRAPSRPTGCWSRARRARSATSISPIPGPSRRWCSPTAGRRASTARCRPRSARPSRTRARVAARPTRTSAT